MPTRREQQVSEESKVRPELSTLFNDAADNLRGRIVAIYVILFAFNIGAWLWAGIAFRHYPVLLGTALLAYSFGLRRAVDADHIAAIDNVTRKLMQEENDRLRLVSCFRWVIRLSSSSARRPLGAALALQHRLDAVRDIAGVVGTLVSALFYLPSLWSI